MKEPKTKQEAVAQQKALADANKSAENLREAERAVVVIKEGEAR